jgi:hypothetical protein
MVRSNEQLSEQDPIIARTSLFVTRTKNVMSDQIRTKKSEQVIIINGTSYYYSQNMILLQSEQLIIIA